MMTAVGSENNTMSTVREETAQSGWPLLPGLGGIAFPVLTFVFLFLASPLGGTYKVSEAKDFVASSHRPAAFVALYAGVIAATGLMWLLIGLRNAIGAESDVRYGSRRIFMATGLAAAVCFAAGYCIDLSAPVAYAVATGGDAFSLPPSTIYAMGQIGNAAVFGAGSILLGIALLMLAAWSTFPRWLRWVTGVAGVLGLASDAFFPWFALLIWSLVVGIWLLASPRARLA